MFCFFFPTGYTCTTQAHSFTTTTCFYGAIESVMMWAVSSPDHFRKIALLGIGGVSIWLQLLWILRQCNATIWDKGATVIKKTFGCLGKGWKEYVSQKHHLCSYRHLHWTCCRWFVSSPLMFLAPPMKQITHTLPPVVSGRAQSFTVFHGFPPSPLYDGSEWTSMAPKTKCQKDVYCTVYPSFILPAIPFSLCTFPLSFLCVYIPVPPCLPGFPCFFFFFYLPLSICLLFLSFSGHADDTGLGQTKWFHSAEACQGEIA